MSKYFELLSIGLGKLTTSERTRRKRRRKWGTRKWIAARRFKDVRPLRLKLWSENVFLQPPHDWHSV
jgi:hypothetical protein